MKFLELFKRKKKMTLRDVCVELYGEEFGEKYDTINEGGTIGNIFVTIEFLRMVEDAKIIYNKRGFYFMKNKIYKRQIKPIRHNTYFAMGVGDYRVPIVDQWFDESEENKLKDKYENSFDDPFDKLEFDERYVEIKN